MSRQMSLNRHMRSSARAIRLVRQHVGALVVAGCCCADPAFAADLTPGEIRSELVGHSIVWWEDGGWRQGQLVLAPDGSAEITVDRPQASGDVGRWSIRDGEICTEWSEIRSGQAKCYSIRRDEAGRFVTSGGNVFEVREAGV
jgi:hypothetical protein